MIRVTIDLLPGGDESRARAIGLIEIANDMSGAHPQVGNYAVVLRKTPPWKGALRHAWKRGTITDPNAEVVEGRIEGLHREHRGVYDMVYLALVACGIAKRNPLPPASGAWG